MALSVLVIKETRDRPLKRKRKRFSIPDNTDGHTQMVTPRAPDGAKNFPSYIYCRVVYTSEPQSSVVTRKGTPSSSTEMTHHAFVGRKEGDRFVGRHYQGTAEMNEDGTIKVGDNLYEEASSESAYVDEPSSSTTN